MAKTPDVENQVGNLFAGEPAFADGEVDVLPAFDLRSIHLDRDDGVVGTAVLQHRADGAPLDLAPVLAVVLGKKRDDQFALLAVVTSQLEVAVEAQQLCLIPLVIKHSILAKHFGQSIDDVADKPPMLAGERHGDGEAF